MAHGWNNRVWCDTATVGTGNVTVGAAKSAHCTPAQSGTLDGDNRTWLLEEGNDFEIFRGLYTAAGAVVQRGTVFLSQIAGVTGTTRMNLAGTATIREVVAAEDIIPIANTGLFGRNMLAAAAASDGRNLLDLIKQSSLVDATANRVLTTGSFGIGGPPIIVTNGNCLADRPSGWYYFNGTIANVPPGAGEGFVFVNRLSVNDILFEYRPYTTSDCWFCAKSSGSYGPWINVGSAMNADRAYRRGNVLAAVGMSGSVPSGGLVEYGTNSAGRYARFVDGTQICWMTNLTFGVITTAVGAVFEGTEIQFALPASFSGDFVLSTSTDSTNIWHVTNMYGTSAFTINLFCFSSISSSRKFGSVAIGRWI